MIYLNNTSKLPKFYFGPSDVLRLDKDRTDSIPGQKN